MKTVKKITLVLLMILTISAFTFKRNFGSSVLPLKEAFLLESDLSKSLKLETSFNAEIFSDSFYNLIFHKENALNKKVYNYALKGYVSLLRQGLLLKKDTLTIIDYSLSANVKRLWVLDLKNQTVLFHELVAHGRNSGSEFARTFSNTTNSFKTSLGFFLTGDIYDGKHEMSIKLYGVENKFNGNAFERGIVIHGADYVSENFIQENQRLGRSLGCPAVSSIVISEISKVISNGTCMFAYYPNKTYLKGSKLLKG